jgi:hypothetical protein
MDIVWNSDHPLGKVSSLAQNCAILGVILHESGLDGYTRYVAHEGGICPDISLDIRDFSLSLSRDLILRAVRVGRPNAYRT